MPPKKPAAKKAPAKKPVAKKPAPKKTAPKKAAPAAKKPAAKKAAAPAKKPAAKKAAPVARKAPAAKTPKETKAATVAAAAAAAASTTYVPAAAVAAVTATAVPSTPPATTTATTPPATTTVASSSSAEEMTRGVTLDLSDKKAEVVFSFDTTGSMYPCLTQVRRNIKDCVKRLFTEIGDVNLRIGITAHGDYCDAKYPQSYVTKHLPLTNDQNAICDFVENVSSTFGGDAPECYELVLHEAQSFSWTPGWKHVLVLIGDELPHEPSYSDNTLKLDWRAECDKLKAIGVQVHGVQALNRKHATTFYAEISRRTEGVHMPLDQFSSISDLVLAVCFREARPSVLEAFEKEVQTGGRYNRSLQNAFDKMLGRERKVGDAPTNMNAVVPGRFQVLTVGPGDAVIKDFVQAQGVTFKAGRGFYEFTKPEMIQDNKEIILMDPKTGDMFEGAYARTLINAPIGSGKKRIAPGEIDYIPFIQSNSHNRRLIGGTRFLYEISEGF